MPPDTPGALLSASLLQFILDSAPSVAWTTDRELRLTAVFGAGLSGIQATASDIVGKTLHQFFETDDESFPPIAAHRLALTGTTNCYAATIAGRVFHAMVMPLETETQGIVGAIGVAQDTTEQVKALEARRETEWRYRTILEDHTDPVARFKPDSTLIFVNDAYCAFFHHSREELLGRTFLSLLSPEDAEITRASLAMHTPAVPIRTNVERLVWPDGQVRWQQWVNRAFFDAAGQVYEFQSVGRDITALKNAEEAAGRERENLRQMLELYDRDRRLTSYEIHDGLAQQLAGAAMQLQAYRRLRESHPNEAEQALVAGQRLVAQGLQESRRLISGLRPPILDESGIVAAIEHLLHDLRRAGGPKIRFRRERRLGRLAAPLENALFRIAQESLNNVVRHSQSPRCSIRLERHDDAIRLEIRDWGVGFDPSRVANDRYGLRGIRDRARLLGGRAKISSRAGRGSRVCVELPLIPPVAPAGG